MNERKHFIDAHQRGELGVAELCRRFGISRKAGYKWLERFYADGADDEEALRDRSRRPHGHPRAVPTWLEEALVHAREDLPAPGPRATSPAQPPDTPLSAPFGAIKAPNALWCVDFKGHFAVGRVRCHPLPVMDAYSRYLGAWFALRHLDAVHVRRAFERIFDEFRLPEAFPPRLQPRATARSPRAAHAGLLSPMHVERGVTHVRDCTTP